MADYPRPGMVSMRSARRTLSTTSALLGQDSLVDEGDGKRSAAYVGDLVSA
jgi:hypothetical protein